MTGRAFHFPPLTACDGLGQRGGREASSYRRRGACPRADPASSRQARGRAKFKGRDDCSARHHHRGTYLSAVPPIRTAAVVESVLETRCLSEGKLSLSLDIVGLVHQRHELACRTPSVLNRLPHNLWCACIMRSSLPSGGKGGNENNSCKFIFWRICKSMSAGKPRRRSSQCPCRRGLGSLDTAGVDPPPPRTLRPQL